EFITLVGSAAATSIIRPTATHAQQAAIPVVGFIISRGLHDSRNLLDPFRAGLGTHGYVEGHNVAIEYRWADGQYDRLPALATDLVSRRIGVLIGANLAAMVAAKAATATIPIVFVTGDDPVKLGFVSSLNRPEG